MTSRPFDRFEIQGKGTSAMRTNSIVDNRPFAFMLRLMAIACLLCSFASFELARPVEAKDKPTPTGNGSTSDNTVTVMNNTTSANSITLECTAPDSGNVKITIKIDASADANFRLDTTGDLLCSNSQHSAGHLKYAQVTVPLEAVNDISATSGTATVTRNGGEIELALDLSFGSPDSRFIALLDHPCRQDSYDPAITTWIKRLSVDETTSILALHDDDVRGKKTIAIYEDLRYPAACGSVDFDELIA